MNVTIHKTAPQPTPKVEGFTLELTDREGFILSRILGKHSKQSTLNVANNIGEGNDINCGNAVIDSPITGQRGFQFQ